MGLFQKLFGRPRHIEGQFYRTITETSPSFTAYSGGVYGQELTRAAIERFATACAKLRPEAATPSSGAVPSAVRRMVDTGPNSTMTWPGFLRRLAAIYDADGTAFVVRVFERDGITPSGIYPFRCTSAEVVEFGGEPWVRFQTGGGEWTAIELRHVCILNKFQVDSDFFGEPNCIDQTMQLIHAQNEAQKAAIKNGAKVRFIGAVNGMARPEDMQEKRERFIETNFAAENNGGLMLYDSTFLDVKQVSPQSYTISDDEMRRIEDNVFNYFGINSDILQNKYTEDTWGAWYEGKVEPFAVSLGEGLTRMLFSDVQVMHGNRISFSANRLEYASNASKRNMVRDMLDRGVFSLNEAREVLQLPPVDGGDERVIRGEYVNANDVSHPAPGQNGGQMPKNVNEEDRDPGGDDDIYKDSDAYGRDDFEDD